ncbi:MAG TPA: hypothetical protein VKF15_05705 [Nitrososphaerales archaeon]|nr:hypothetical protein [Nitrososphaerales archaeon]
MRVLDLAAAALVGVISVSLIASMDPVPFDAASRGYAEEIALRGLLLRIVEEQGIPWLRSASAQQVCAAVGLYSNSSVTVSAAIAGAACRPPPREGTPFSSLTLPFAPSKVTLESWTSAGR